MANDDDLNGEDGFAEGPEGDQPMSFWDHFAELRKRITRAVIAIVIGFAASFAFADVITAFLRVPLHEAWADAGQEGIPDLQVLGIQDPILVDFRVALMAGIFFSLPIIFWQMWSFISPGLYKNEKKFIIPFVFFSVLLFLVGAWFAYQYVLPFGYAFLLNYGDGRGLVIRPELANYIKGTSRILLAFGAAFEFPLLIAFLAKAGVVTERTLLKFWKVAILLIFIAAAFLTPPEPVTQLMMAGPLVVLFFLSVGVAYFINPAPKDDELADAELPDDPDDPEPPDGR